jgi:hypothetical protein
MRACNLNMFGNKDFRFTQLPVSGSQRVRARQEQYGGITRVNCRCRHLISEHKPDTSNQRLLGWHMCLSPIHATLNCPTCAPAPGAECLHVWPRRLCAHAHWRRQVTVLPAACNAVRRGDSGGVAPHLTHSGSGGAGGLPLIQDQVGQGGYHSFRIRWGRGVTTQATVAVCTGGRRASRGMMVERSALQTFLHNCAAGCVCRCIT